MFSNVRSIAVSIAVMCFFAAAIIGWVCNVSPFTCCKRSLTAAVLAYVATILAVKAIKAIVINAIINRQINRLKEETGESTD